jgi:hypothetical protein
MEIFMLASLASLPIFGGSFALQYLLSPDTKRSTKQRALCGIFAYLGSYEILSSQGSYLAGNHGGNDNHLTWYARYCGYQYQKPSGRISNFVTPLGAIFWPLALIDAQLVHPEKEF